MPHDPFASGIDRSKGLSAQSGIKGIQLLFLRLHVEPNRLQLFV